MAPEYIMGGTLSTKCDVYGFGIIILEIISSLCKSQPTHGHASIEWVRESMHTLLMYMVLK
jgi:serine/threonine protein kinase